AERLLEGRSLGRGRQRARARGELGRHVALFGLDRRDPGPQIELRDVGLGRLAAFGRGGLLFGGGARQGRQRGQSEGEEAERSPSAHRREAISKGAGHGGDLTKRVTEAANTVGRETTGLRGGSRGAKASARLPPGRRVC